MDSEDLDSITDPMWAVNENVFDLLCTQKRMLQVIALMCAQLSVLVGVSTKRDDVANQLLEDVRRTVTRVMEEESK